VLIYAVILLVLVGAFLWSVAERVPLIVDVLRDRNALYRNAADGGIENAYTLKLMNQDQRTHHYRIQIESALPITLAAGADRVTVAAEQVVELPLTLKVAAGQAKGVNGIRIRVQSEDDAAVFYVQETRFFGPF